VTEPTHRVAVDQTLAHLMPLFMSNRLELLDAAQACCEAGDLERLQLIGHNFKGASGSYGFQYLSSLGAELQVAADLNTASELLRRMREHLEQVQVDLV